MIALGDICLTITSGNAIRFNDFCEQQKEKEKENNYGFYLTYQGSIQRINVPGV